MLHADASCYNHSRLHVTLFMHNASPYHHPRLLLLQGKEPWNKGQRLDQGICDKMSAAKQGHTVPRSVCAKMSRSHAGLRPSQVCINNLLLAFLCQAWV